MQWRSQDNTCTCMYGRVHTARCRICIKLRKTRRGKVREGWPPAAQLGGMGECCSSPIGVWGGAPGANSCLMHKYVNYFYMISMPVTSDV